MTGKSSCIVERLLTERMGLDPASLGEGLIARGVQSRMTALGLHSRADYERALFEHEDEFQALVEEVVVPESWFFRDDRPFQLLADFARAGWLNNPDRPPLTALSIPCAGGEEPYSIAMTLLECGFPRDRFWIEAVDISNRALARAIAGTYNSNSFRGPDSSIHSAYFREENGSFTIAPAVRSSVRFHQGNLLASTLFADRPPFDVVFCRNVLIYLYDHGRHQVCENLCRLVVDGGLLFLGHADRLEQPEGGLFEPTEDKGSFAYRKGEVRARKATSARNVRGDLDCGSLPPPSKAVAGSRTPKRAGDVGKSIVAKTPHPGPLPEAESRQAKKAKAAKSTPTESPASILDRASNLADLGRYDEASALAEGLIREGGTDARVFFLLGLIAEAAGAFDRAEAHFLKAIYLDPQDDEALLALALLVRRKGDLAAEATYRRRAERVLARKAVS
jgi:chemotaxis protein methyltransferase WspC